MHPFRFSKIVSIFFLLLAVSNGALFAEESDFSQLVAEYKAAIKENPKDPILFLRLGELYLENGNKGASKVYFNMVESLVEAELDTEEASARSYYLLGMSAMYRGRFAVAENFFVKSLELDETYQMAMYRLVKLHSDRGNGDKAMALLEAALSEDPGSEKLRQTIALQYKVNGDVEQSIAAFEALRADYPENENYLASVLEAYLSIGDAERASECLDLLVAKGEIAEFDKFLHLAKMHLDREEYRMVPRLLQQAKKLKGDDPDLAIYYAMYYSAIADQAMENEQYSRAIVYWERALEYKPDSRTIRQGAGSCYYHLEDYESAHKNFYFVLESLPNDAEFYADYSLTLMALSQIDQAFTLIKEGFEIIGELNDVDGIALLQRTHKAMQDDLRQRIEDEEALEATEPTEE